LEEPVPRQLETAERARGTKRLERMPRPCQVGQRVWNAVEERITTVAGEDQLRAMGSSTGEHLDLHGAGGRHERRRVDTMDEVGATSRILRSNAKDFAPEMTRERLEMGSIVAVGAVVERDCENRAPTLSHELHREPEQSTGVDAAPRQDGNATSSTNRARNGALYDATERGGGISSRSRQRLGDRQLTRPFRQCAFDVHVRRLIELAWWFERQPTRENCAVDRSALRQRREHMMRPPTDNRIGTWGAPRELECDTRSAERGRGR